MKRNKLLLFIIPILILLGSCSDYLDINDDPNNPVDVPINQILPASQVAIGYNLGTLTGGLSNAASTFVHQTYSTRVNEYSITGNYVNNTWNGLFTSGLNNLQIIIEKGTANGDYKYVGISKIMKAYTYSILVDLFGDLPYSEALKGDLNTEPVYEEDRIVYDSLFTLINQGIADIEKSGGLVPATDDLIYNGSLLKWRRFAKTLKLKMLNQIRLERDVKEQISALITEGDLITDTDDFELPFGTTSQPPNRNPGFLSEYAGSGRESFVSRWFYEIMIGANSTILNGIVDPRVPYYFYHQKSDATLEANANYQNGRFITRQFGTTLANGNVTNLQTLHGLYPMGGRYDDGLGGTATATSGPGNVAQRLLPYFNRKFIEAEVGLTLEIGDAKQALEAGIRAAFAKVNKIAVATPTNIQTVPQINATQINDYVNAILALYDAADQDGKLEIIMTQKWIASYGFGIDAYTDYRRTGYPILYVPNQSDNTQSANPFPLRFPYRDQDLTSNPKAPAQANIYVDRIFWDKN